MEMYPFSFQWVLDEHRLIHFAIDTPSPRGQPETPKIELEAAAGSVQRFEDRKEHAVQRKEAETKNAEEDRQALQKIEANIQNAGITANRGETQESQDTQESVPFKFKVELQNITLSELAEIGITFDEDVISFDNREHYKKLAADGKPIPRTPPSVKKLQLNDATEKITFGKFAPGIVMDIYDKVQSDGSYAQEVFVISKNGNIMSKDVRNYKKAAG